MTSNSDLSPDDVKKAQALAPQLDPDIARAITEGNGPVMQAIKRGARTDAEITQTLISMGLTTGLPPGLQQMVNEQEKQNSEKRDPDAARAERLEKLASGAFGMGLTGGAGNDQTSSSGSSGVKSWAEMTIAERSAYFGALASMSYDDYAKQSGSVRQQGIHNLSAEGQARVAEGKKGLAEFPNRILSDPKYGATLEERQATLRQIEQDSDYDSYNWEGFEKNLKGKNPEVQKAMLDRRALLYKARLGQDIQDAGQNAQVSHNENDLHGEHKHVQGGAKDGKTLEEKLARVEQYRGRIEQNATALAAAATAEQKHQIGLDTDRAALEGRKLASAQQMTQLAQASTTEQKARINERATIAAASLQAASGDGGFGADEPAPVVAQGAAPTKERLSNDLTRLQQAGMVQLPGVTAQVASVQPEPSPNPTDQKPQKPEGSGPSGGGTPA